MLGLNREQNSYIFTHEAKFSGTFLRESRACRDMKFGTGKVHIGKQCKDL